MFPRTGKASSRSTPASSRARLLRTSPDGGARRSIRRLPFSSRTGYRVARLYTRTGDAGTTGLPGGRRVPKDDPIVALCGALDELSATIGMAIAMGASPGAMEVGRAIQADLLLLGAALAVLPNTPNAPLPAAKRLEPLIDALDAETPPLSTFILPGGSPAAAALHVARTVCRRAEREYAAASRVSTVPGDGLVYLNRLADLLFALARAENLRAGVADVPWRGSDIERDQTQ